MMQVMTETLHIDSVQTDALVRTDSVGNWNSDDGMAILSASVPNSDDSVRPSF